MKFSLVAVWLLCSLMLIGCQNPPKAIASSSSSPPCADMSPLTDKQYIGRLAIDFSKGFGLSSIQFIVEKVEPLGQETDLPALYKINAICNIAFLSDFPQKDRMKIIEAIERVYVGPKSTLAQREAPKGKLVELLPRKQCDNKVVVVAASDYFREDWLPKNVRIGTRGSSEGEGVMTSTNSEEGSHASWVIPVSCPGKYSLEIEYASTEPRPAVLKINNLIVFPESMKSVTPCNEARCQAIHSIGEVALLRGDWLLGIARGGNNIPNIRKFIFTYIGDA